jgi:hypothetical protein
MTINKKAPAWRWASVENAARATIVKRQPRKNSGRDAMSVDATKRAVAMTVSGAFATRCTLTSIAGRAATMIAARTCKKWSRAKKRLASNLREQRKVRCTSYARYELCERGRRDGSCLHRRNDNDDGGDYCNDCDRHRQRGARGARGTYGCDGRDGRDGRDKRGGCDNQPNNGRGTSSEERGRRRESDNRRANAPKKAWLREQ